MTPSYNALVRSRIAEGRPVPSRYGTTHEQLGSVMLSFESGEIPQRSGLNLNIGWCEMLQLIAGVFDITAYERSAPAAMLHLFTENGAYGPRIAEQLDRIVPMMTVDPSGRQHTAYVARDGDQYTSDMPCTNSMHWFIRGGRLYMHVFMRSSDVVKGLPYDMMMFGGLNMAIARCVGVVPGPVLLNAASSHIYEEDISKGKTAEVLTRRFQFNDQVPKTWSEVKDWALQENTAMPAETYPMGITMLRKEGRIHV